MEINYVQSEDYDIGRLIYQPHNKISKRFIDLKKISYSDVVQDLDKESYFFKKIIQLKINDHMILKKGNELNIEKAKKKKSNFKLWDSCYGPIEKLILERKENRKAMNLLDKYWDIDKIYQVCSYCKKLSGIFNPYNRVKSYYCFCEDIYYEDISIQNKFKNYKELEEIYGLDISQIIKIQQEKKLKYEYVYFFPTFKDLGFDSEKSFKSFLKDFSGPSDKLVTFNPYNDSNDSGMLNPDLNFYLQILFDSKKESFDEISIFTFGTGSSFCKIFIEYLKLKKSWEDFFSLSLIDFTSEIDHRLILTKNKIIKNISAFNFNYSGANIFLFEDKMLEFNKFVRSILYLDLVVFFINPFDNPTDIQLNIKLVKKIKNSFSNIIIIFTFESRTFEYINLNSTAEIHQKILYSKKNNISINDLEYLLSFPHYQIYTKINKILNYIFLIILENSVVE